MTTFGNDFEFFIYSNKENKIVSAIRVLKQNKKNPIDLGDGVTLYYDNCLGEVAFPPYTNKKEMKERFASVFSKVRNYLGPKYKMVFQAGHSFDDDQVTEKEAQEIGCEPSYDVWEELEIVTNDFQDNFRSSGGHWHIGSKLLTDKPINRPRIVKLLDIYLGCANVVNSDDPTEVRRRRLYGAAGNHRIPEYGVEYRTLSSSFLNSEEQTDLSFDLIGHCLKCIQNDTAVGIINSVDANLVRAAINNCNKELAKRVLEQADVPDKLMQRIGG